MARAWNEISKDYKYINLSPDDKETVRNSYFQKYIAPNYIDESRLSEAKVEFDKQTLPGSGEYQLDRFKRGAAGVVDLVGMPMGVRADEMGGVQNLQAPNKLQRYMGGVSEFAGGGLVTAPLLGLGGSSNLGRTAFQEGISILGGGLGSEGMGEFGDQYGHRNTGEAVGGLMGVGAGVGLGSLFSGLRKGKNTFRDRKALMSGYANRRIGGMLQQDPNAIENILEAQTIADKINAANKGKPGAINPEIDKVVPENSSILNEGVDFNLAQASDSAGVKGLYSIYEQASPEKAQGAMIRQQNTLNKINQAQESMFPGGGSSVDKAAGKSLDKTLSKIDVRTQKAIEDRGLLAAQNQRNTPQTIGAELKTIRDSKAKAIRAEVGAKYEALYVKADEEGFSTDMSDIANVVKKTFGDDANVFQRPDMPAVLGQIHRRYIKKNTPDLPKATNIQQYQAQQEMLASTGKKQSQASFQELHSLYREVNKDLRTSTLRGDSNSVRVLEQVKSALKDKLDNIGQSGSSIGQEFIEINAEYATRYADIYKKGTGAKLAAPGKYGDITKDEDVVRSLFFKSDMTSGLDDFIKIYGDDPDAMKMLHGGVMDIFVKETKDINGLIDPRKIKAFTKKYELMLDRLPNIKKTILDVDSRNTALLDRANVLGARKSNIEKMKLSKLLESDNTDDVLDFLISDQTGSNKALTRVFLKANSSGSGEEFARQLARRIGTRGDSFEYVMKNEKLLKPIFDKIGKDHYDNLKTIIRAYDIANRTVPKIGAHTEAVVDPLGKATGTPIASLFAQYRAANQGRTSYPQIMVTMGAKLLTKLGADAVFRATEQALFDPNLAATLVRLTGKTEKTASPALISKFRAHLATAGIRSASQFTQTPSEPVHSH